MVDTQCLKATSLLTPMSQIDQSIKSDSMMMEYNLFL